MQIILIVKLRTEANTRHRPKHGLLQPVSN
jgi:hypothetical protein